MALVIGSGLIGVGEPALGLSTDGSPWDFGPWFVAAAVLLVLRSVLSVRIRWYVVVLTVLAAPPAIAFADWVGPWITLAFAACALVVARSILARRRRAGTV